MAGTGFPARNDIVRPEAVEFFGEFQGRIVALALLGEEVQDDGAIVVLREFKQVDEQGQVVPVHRAEIAQTHLLEEQAVAIAATAIRAEIIGARLQPDLRYRALEPFLGLVRELERELALGQTAHKSFEILRPPVVARVRDDLVQVGGNRADVFGDAPLVVVEDADEFFGGVRDVVERLVGNAVGQRRVAEDADDVLVRALLVTRRAHAQRRRQRRARVAGAVAIVRAFGAEREAVQTARLPDGVKTILASREQLVNVSLMAHVPDKLVFGRAEHVVQGQRQLHHAEIRAQMAAILGQHGDQLVPDFAGQLLQLLQREFLDVQRFGHHVEVSAHSFCNWLSELNEVNAFASIRVNPLI